MSDSLFPAIYLAAGLGLVIGAMLGAIKRVLERG